MRYLENLAEKLVLAYEDEENVRQWISLTERVNNRHRLIKILKITLEQEIAEGNLACRPENKYIAKN